MKLAEALIEREPIVQKTVGSQGGKPKHIVTADIVTQPCQMRSTLRDV